MALVSLSSKCFNVVEAAHEAVKTGDAGRSAVMLKSIKEDGSRLQQQASILCDQLNKAEKEHQEKIEVLTYACQIGSKCRKIVFIYSNTICMSELQYICPNCNIYF